MCRENGDSVRMKLYVEIIEQDQIHYNYFDNIRGHIENLVNSYLSRSAGTSLSTGLGPSGFAASPDADQVVIIAHYRRIEQIYQI